MTLVEFLLARIAEDEAAAREALEPIPVRALYEHVEPSWEAWAGLDRESGDIEGPVFMEPARVLAECEAKRRIVALHPPIALGAMRGCSGCQWDADGSADYGGDCETLIALALPYADHPDYREEWRP